MRHCDRNCWMIGSVSPAMHKYIMKPVLWVAFHKLKFWKKKKYSMYELKCCRDYRDGKLTKEMCDQCSTCDRLTAAKEKMVKNMGVNQRFMALLLLSNRFL